MKDQPEFTEDAQPFEAPTEPVSSGPAQPEVTEVENLTPDEMSESTSPDELANNNEPEVEEEQSAQQPTDIITPLPTRSRKWLPWAIAAVVLVELVAGVLVYLDLTAQRSASSNNTSTVAKVSKLGAAVVYVQGTVEYARSGDWKAATGELSLSEGDQVRTGNESRAVIAFDDGSAIRLDAQSEVTLKSLTVASIIVENQRGNVYSRVTTSDSRKFDVVVADSTYRALGTAYMTTNSETTKGVEVYHSQVSVDEKTTVGEGQSYFAKNPDEAKRAKVAQIDLAGLKTNAFLKWNKSEDAKDTKLADKLGVLKDIDTEATPAQTAPKTTAPATPQPTAKITVRGEKSGDGVLVSWSVSGIDTKNGFKVVYSKSNTSPTYGADSAKFMEGSSRSVNLALQDGKTWHIRVCRYDGDGKCSYYSNTVSVAAPYKEVEKVTLGGSTASLSGSTVSWTSTGGTAPYGFKVVWNTSGSPTYPTSGSNAGAQYMSSGSSLNLNEAISSPGTYKVRVCKYTNGTEASACVDYSNELTYVKS